MVWEVWKVVVAGDQKRWEQRTPADPPFAAVRWETDAADE